MAACPHRQIGKVNGLKIRKVWVRVPLWAPLNQRETNMIDHQEILKKLAELYKITGEDWNLTISVSLTEPTPPMASITPESRKNSTRYTAWGDSIEDAVNQAIDAVHREVILGERIQPSAP